jgi:hypothetical protein
LGIGLTLKRHPATDARRREEFLDVPAFAHRALHKTLPELVVKGGMARKPTLEPMAEITLKVKYDHVPILTSPS